MSEANAALGTQDQSGPTPAQQPAKSDSYTLAAVVISQCQKEQPEPQPKEEQVKNTSDMFAAWVIGLYLAAQIVILCWIALTAWLTSDCSSWWPFLFTPLHLPCPVKLSPEKLAAFQRLVISGCMAGLGGAVYALRKFYLTYAYGYQPPDKDGKKPPMEFLRRKEIPRYVLLPFSSVILGPITMALAQGGVVTFAGLTSGKELPMFTVVGLSFVLGFSYHDTLNGLARLSETLFSKRTKDHEDKANKEAKKQGEAAKATAAGK